MNQATDGITDPVRSFMRASQIHRLLRIGPALSVILGLILLTLFALIHVGQGQADIDFATAFRGIVLFEGSPTDNIIRYIRLPRTAIAILCGGALAMAGVLMQSVIRNPLASPSTLGVSSGAYLALVLSTLYAPSLFGFSPLAIAFAGGTIAALLAYAIAGSVSLTPLRLALAGVAVSLVCAAVTAVLQLFNEYQVGGLFLWGAGSLTQIDWSGASYVLPRLFLGLVGALLLSRSLDVLSLGDDVARGLGQRTRTVRAIGLLISIFLAAVAVSVVGPIGFVGLIVPHIVRLFGVRGHLNLILISALWGGVFLLGADVIARLILGTGQDIPTGGVTAMLGAPVFILLARRARGFMSTRESARSSVSLGQRRSIPYPLMVAGLFIGLGLTMVVGLRFGDVDLGAATVVQTVLGQGTEFTSRIVLDLRLPRTVVAATVGAALALSGLLLQGVLRNPLAGPEIVGVTGGAGLGALLIIVFFPSLPFTAVPIAAFIGSFLAVAIVYVSAWQEGEVDPGRLALVGVAVTAFCAAATSMLIAMSQLEVGRALVWLSGSTYARGWGNFLQLIPWMIVLVPLAFVAARHLDILRLGDATAAGLGMRVERMRLAVLTIAVALAASAVSAVGTISFVGLIGPHSARLMLGADTHHRKLVPLAALLGAITVVLADIIGRTILAPREIPSGLVTTLIGAPYFLWLLWRSRR